MLDDLLELGVKHIDDNILLSGIFDWNSENPEAWFELDGERYPLNMNYIRYFDGRFKWLTDHNISTTLIVLNGVPREPDPKNPFIHPWTDLANTPYHLGGINIYDERGFKWYRAALEFLSERYTRPDAEYGLLDGFIIANEVQAHWVWSNLGECTPSDFLDEYIKALRVSWLAAKKHHSGLKVYASLDHHWAKRYGSSTQWITGPEVLEGLAAKGQAEGDFGWDVAFHPYPDDLFNPRFWLEKTTPLSFGAQKISFNNLEVLPVFLSQPHLLYNGQQRRILLSEQGIHKPDSPDGEQLQAASFALAYWKVNHIPGIEAFIYFRHISGNDPAGLLFGLWDVHPDDPSGNTPGKKLLLWDVVRAADTPEWEQTTAFALPIIGVESWQEALPKPPSAVDRTRAKYPQVPLDETLVVELANQLQFAERENCLDWRPEVLEEGGVLYPAIFHHPPAEGLGKATFTLDLPVVSRRELLTLRFGTAFGADSDNGAGFSVLINDNQVWAHEQTTRESESHEVDLTGYQGEQIRLTLCIDALGNAGHDWALWVWPRIIEESKELDFTPDVAPLLEQD